MLGYDDHLESIEACAERISNEKTRFIITLSKEAKAQADKAKEENVKQREQLHREYLDQAAAWSTSSQSDSQGTDSGTLMSSPFLKVSWRFSKMR
jgi:hypothetical protein